MLTITLTQIISALKVYQTQGRGFDSQVAMLFGCGPFLPRVAVIEVLSVMCRGAMHRRLICHSTEASLANSKEGMLQFGGVTGDCLQCVSTGCVVV
jgi:hypothetical protein